MMSSKLEAAIRLVGIPLATPYPLSCKIMQEGTSTAGLTAPIVKPRAKHRARGIPMTKREIKAIEVASKD